MDNQSYVNIMGGTVSTQATLIARDMWMWCLRRAMNLSAKYFPGKENTIADEKFREMKDCSDWMLNTGVFKHIARHFRDLNANLFSSKLIFQLPRYLSLRRDPASGRSHGCFPTAPERLYQAIMEPHRKVHLKGKETTGKGVPGYFIWPSQPWYLKLLSMLPSTPLRIPPRADLIKETWKGCLPEIIPL